jgi:enoyl-CoA hydratase
MSDLVQIEIDGRIAIVRFDTGARANALSQQLMQDLTEAALQFHDTPEISTVILTGRADQFSMGADLKDPAGTTAAKSSLRERRILFAPWPTHV